MNLLCAACACFIVEHFIMFTFGVQKDDVDLEIDYSGVRDPIWEEPALAGISVEYNSCEEPYFTAARDIQPGKSASERTWREGSTAECETWRNYA